MTSFNRSILATLHFAYPTVLFLVQIVVSLLLLEVVQLFRQAPAKSSRDDDINVHRALPLSVAFVGTVLTNLAGVTYLDPAMWKAARRATSLITMWSQYYMLGKPTSLHESIAVYCTVFGATMAAYVDVAFSVAGYALVLLNCTFTASYLVLMQKYTSHHVNKTDDILKLMFYNHMLALPVVLCICLVFGDFSGVVIDSQLVLEPLFLSMLLLQAVLAFGLNYAVFLCTSINSALTTSVTGLLKNLLVMAAAMFFFGDMPHSATNLAGLVIGFASGAWYINIKMVEWQHRKFAVQPVKLMSQVPSNSSTPAPVRETVLAINGRSALPIQS